MDRNTDGDGDGDADADGDSSKRIPPPRQRASTRNPQVEMGSLMNWLESIEKILEKADLAIQPMIKTIEPQINQICDWVEVQHEQRQRQTQF